MYIVNNKIMVQTRLETDLLGSKKIPAEALWGIHTSRAVENFPITGRRIHPELIKVVVDENDKIIGFLIAMPSLTKAYRKANGHLFPFNFFYLLRAMKTYDILDFYFAGVKKEYRGKGVDLLMAVEIVKSAMKLGFKKAESNQELELNSRVQAEWKFFNPVMHKRRRVYKLKLYSYLSI